MTAPRLHPSRTPPIITGRPLRISSLGCNYERFVNSFVFLVSLILSMSSCATRQNTSAIKTSRSIAFSRGRVGSLTFTDWPKTKPLSRLIKTSTWFAPPRLAHAKGWHGSLLSAVRSTGRCDRRRKPGFLNQGEDHSDRTRRYRANETLSRFRWPVQTECDAAGG